MVLYRLVYATYPPYRDLKVHWQWSQLEDLKEQLKFKDYFALGGFNSLPFLHPTFTSPSELSSCLHLSVKNTNSLFDTCRHTQSYGKSLFWVQHRHLNSLLLPRHLGEIHTTVPLPQLSRTLVETSYSLRSSIFVTFPQCFEKGLVIRVPTYP